MYIIQFTLQKNCLYSPIHFIKPTCALTPFQELITLVCSHLLLGDQFTRLNMLGLSLCMAGVILHVMFKASHGSPKPELNCSSACSTESLMESDDNAALCASGTSRLRRTSANGNEMDDVQAELRNDVIDSDDDVIYDKGDVPLLSHHHVQ